MESPTSNCTSRRSTFDDGGHIELINCNDEDIKYRQIFTELLELRVYDDGVQEWIEDSRWIKYQEAVEPEGDRWSKPHVSTPTLEGYLELRKHLQAGLIMMDLNYEVEDFPTLCRGIGDALAAKDYVTAQVAEKLTELWQLKHRHHFEGPRKMEGKLSNMIKELLVHKSKPKLLERPAFTMPEEEEETDNINVQRQLNGKVNFNLQKKISSSMEAAIILEGVVGFLEKPLAVLVKVRHPLHLADLPEVDIPTRFVFFMVGPPGSGNKELYWNIGAALATALTDKEFVCDMYAAQNGDQVRRTFDEYMTTLKILPRDWPPHHKLDPPSNVNKVIKNEIEEEIDEDRRMREASGLVRTGRLFGGLIDDLKRKKPFYWSDFSHALHPQCLSTFMFLYFACLAPVVAFGGLLGEATENRIATIESLVSGLICGIAFGLFAGQPLILLGSTGPVYVFEKILFSMCKEYEWDYLSLRLCIGLWVVAFLLVLVAFDASAYVCYITRFTEELFASLIAFIFIYNAFVNIASIGMNNKFSPSGTGILCECMIGDEAFTNITKQECVMEPNNGTLVGADCDYEPNMFLLSVILFFGAFFISFTLKNFRNTGYLPGKIRGFLGDFAVIIAIFSMTAIDYVSRVPTPKLMVPSEFTPTWEGRGWLVKHALFFDVPANPWWVEAFLAPLFALLATILIFMDQQITAVICNRKEFLLKKGCGYHLDLLVLSVIILICSVFGLPWFVAATVLCVNHVQSLRKESEGSAPGEKPQFLGIREQRVTNIMIGCCIGLSVLVTPLLALIPMPVLFGVFLFMGVSSLKGLQFAQRLLLVFIPRKYQPDYVYLKYVPLSRVHLFTFIQFSSLLMLWLIKNNPSTSISFPVMLVVICLIRKMMECIFSKRELRLLDDLLPENNSYTRKGLLMRKFSRNFNTEWSSDPDLREDLEDSTRMEREREKAVLRRRAKDLALEADTISFSAIKKEKRKNLSIVKSSDSFRGSQIKLATKYAGGSSPVPIRAKPSVTVFIKLSDSEAYLSIPLRLKTVKYLLDAIQIKNPSFAPNSIGYVYQKNSKGLKFLLDDDMMEYMTNQQIFNLELTPSSDPDKKFDITLEEVASS